MKISPVRSASPAPLPTAAEAAANPALVAPAPAVRPRHASGALLGAGLLGSLLAPAAAAEGAGGAGEAPVLAQVPPSPAESEAAARAEAARAAVATTVAPILQKAMDEEGRGAFGCMAVDSPCFLSETDALNLIEQEFAAAGVKLRDCRELTGYTRTLTDWNAPRKPAGKEQEDVWRYRQAGEGDPARPKKTVPGSWVFDLATEDGALLLEYLSAGDHDRLADTDSGWGSTVAVYDFPRRAERFRADLATRTEGKPVTIGIFFDPLARETTLDRKKGQRDARELLREQVRFFLDWARKEGRLPTQSPQDGSHAENAEPVPQAESGSPAGGAGERSEPEGVPHAESAENAE